LKKASKYAPGRRGQVIGTHPQFKGQNSLTGVFKLLSSILGGGLTGGLTGGLGLSPKPKTSAGTSAPAA
jgi:hypothetical protein